MAGTVELAPEELWSVPGWLFYWTVEFLAENVLDPDLKAALEEISTENLGWLGLGDYGARADREMRELLRTKLIAAADASFEPDLDGRDVLLSRLRQLADAV